MTHTVYNIKESSTIILQSPPMTHLPMHSHVLLLLLHSRQKKMNHPPSAIYYFSWLLDCRENSLIQKSFIEDNMNIVN